MGKMIFRKWSSFFLVLLLAVTVGVLSGCSGDDGNNGAPGAAGLSAYEIAVNNGFVGTEAEWLASLAAAAQEGPGESCNVCHGEDADWDIAVAHPEPLVKPVVSNIVVARSAGDVLTVTFHVDDGAGNPVPGIIAAPGDAGNIRVYMADIVPAGTVTGNLPQTTWRTDFLEIWAEERGDDVGVIVADLGGGNYSFQMAATAPFVGVGTDAPEGDLALHHQRVYVRADARDIEGFNRTMGVADFDFPAAGANTGDITGQIDREIVVMAACTACHNDPLQRAAHGGGYQSPQVCIMCHSPIGIDGDEMQADGAWLASLIHAIHSSSPDQTAWDFSEVTYPKNIKDCEACHFDDGQNDADAWYANPSSPACGSCHNDADAEAHLTAVADLACLGCHNDAIAVGIQTAHEVTTLKHNPDGSDNPVSITPNYTSTITLSEDADANGVYEAGEAILVTVTTSNLAAGDYIIPTADGGPRTANLYVYGPRAKALPVLTTGSTTDPVNPGISQGHSMLITSTDPQVMTDADGFKYQLLAIPDDLPEGTYMVLAYVTTNVADCSGVYRTNTCIDGWQMTTFQVGTAVEELRVAGDCTQNCHVSNDWGSMFHRSYFGTDGCLACHDQSGNHANQISNRVHAIHAARVNGDLLGYDWSEITFPQNDDSCGACHTSGNDSFITLPNGEWGAPCIGCHGDTDGAKAHMELMGSEFPAEE